MLALECTEEASRFRDASPKALLPYRLAPKSLLPSYWIPGPLGKVNKCRIRSPHLALHVLVQLCRLEVVSLKLTVLVGSFKSCRYRTLTSQAGEKERLG